MPHLESYLTLLDVDMEMGSYPSLFYRYQKVSHFLFLTFSCVSSLIYFIASKRQRKRPEFQRFCRQLYHRCLEIVFGPLKPYMEKYKVVKCPDGHFRRAIFGLGPYIADYPEQVWLAGGVSGWCPKWVIHTPYFLATSLMYS